VPEPVVVVSRESEGVLRPLPERHLGVGVVAAEHQDEGVEEEEPVEERREREPRRRRDEDRRADEHRGDLEEPGEPVLRADPGDDERGEGQHEEDERLAPRRCGVGRHGDLRAD